MVRPPRRPLHCTGPPQSEALASGLRTSPPCRIGAPGRFFAGRPSYSAIAHSSGSRRCSCHLLRCLRARFRGFIEDPQPPWRRDQLCHLCFGWVLLPTRGLELRTMRPFTLPTCGCSIRRPGTRDGTSSKCRLGRDPLGGDSRNGEHLDRFVGRRSFRHLLGFVEVKVEFLLLMPLLGFVAGSALLSSSRQSFRRSILHQATRRSLSVRQRGEQHLLSDRAPESVALLVGHATQSGLPTRATRARALGAGSPGLHLLGLLGSTALFLTSCTLISIRSTVGESSAIESSARP